MSTVEEICARAGERARRDVELGPMTTYRVGGSARLVVTLASREDVASLATAIAASDLHVLTVGNGSNLLVEDGPHDVLVVRLDGEFKDLTWRDEGDRVYVRAGGGLELPVAARRLAAAGVVGFEWAVGVPGTFGGATMMNAGGHGSDMAATLNEVTVLRDGSTTTWSKEDLALGYRHSALRDGDVVLSVTMSLRAGDAATADQRLREIVRWRREHQPGGANAGSVFRNPEGDHAARLIEAAGCKGLRLGSAAVSEKHANFIQADAGGRANDVRALIEEVRERVAASSDLELVSEHRFVGFGVTP